MHAVVLGEDPWSLRVVDDWPEPERGFRPGRRASAGHRRLRLRPGAAVREPRPPHRPWVPGHEASRRDRRGRPRASTAERVGQRVADRAELPVPGPCPACRSGLTSGCLGPAQSGFSVPGVLAERIAVPASFAWPVPGGWSDEDAVCTGTADSGAGGNPALRDLFPSAVGRWAPRQPASSGSVRQGAMLCAGLAAQRTAAPHMIEPQAGRRGLARRAGRTGGRRGRRGLRRGSPRPPGTVGRPGRCGQAGRRGRDRRADRPQPASQRRWPPRWWCAGSCASRDR